MNFHYEDDIISDLPSCVYASQQISNNQGNLRMNSNSLRQIQQQYMHHSAGNLKLKTKNKTNINKSTKTV